MTSFFPFIVIGLFSGSIYALAAMGLVLNYKMSGIFNFAYGAVAMFCAFTFSELRDTWHISQWVSLPLVLFVLAPVFGMAFERLFRPLSELSAEIQIVVALGVLGFLQALAPILFGGQARGLPSIFPTSTFRLGSKLHVGYDQLATLLLTVGLAGALYLLLRRTRFGMATRAVVDNRELSGLVGVRADTISRFAWMLSCVFAALAGILLSSREGLDVYVLVLLVIYAFAPAVLGRLTSLPLAFVGAMCLGIVQSVLARYGSNGTVANFEASIPYLALFVLLLVYGRRLKEVRSSFVPISSLPLRSVRPARSALWAWGVALSVVAVFLPAVLSGPQLSDVSAGVIFAAIALSLVVLTGWAGQISLAQFSFVGIGAFTVAHLSGSQGALFFPAALLGAAIALPVGLIVGLPSLRLTGLYLALATMAFALLMDNLIFSRTSISGGYTGLAVSRPKLGPLRFHSTTSFYYLSLVVLAGFALAAIVLRRGPVGRRLRMINDSPAAAATCGVDLTLTKLAVFTFCAGAAAFAGALFAADRQTVSPSDFSFNASLGLLLLVVLGGRSLVGGAFVAGAVYGAQLFPIPTSVERFIPLAVAGAVILIANNPEGSLSLLSSTFRNYSDVFRRLPRPRALSLGQPAEAPMGRTR